MDATSFVSSRSPSRASVLRGALLLLALASLVGQGSSAQPIGCPEPFDSRTDRRLCMDVQRGGSAAEQVLEAYLRNKLELHGLVQDLNRYLHFQQGVRLSFASMLPRKPEALFVGSAQGSAQPQIIIGYGLVLEFVNFFEGDEEFWYPNLEQIVLHEAAHALIHVNGIKNVNGVEFSREEEELAADALAFFIMSGFYDREDKLIPVVLKYLLRTEEAGSGGVGEPTQHMPDGARADNYLCWILGKTPALSEGMPEELGVRLAGRNCPYEYQELDAAWLELLGPSWNVSNIEADLE